jgi:hypothetical protein
MGRIVVMQRSTAEVGTEAQACRTRTTPWPSIAEPRRQAPHPRWPNLARAPWLMSSG